MIGKALDSFIGALSPQWGVKRTKARKLMRAYAGAESNRLTNNARPKNQAADSELMGPYGADALRAWSRKLVRDNAYAWGVVDTIVSSVVGCGMTAQSMLETDDGVDVEDVNFLRDDSWDRWTDVCDINGQSEKSSKLARFLSTWLRLLLRSFEALADLCRLLLS
jgi:capsid protein